MIMTNQLPVQVVYNVGGIAVGLVVGPPVRIGLGSVVGKASVVGNATGPVVMASVVRRCSYRVVVGSGVCDWRTLTAATTFHSGQS